jgi:hypothetical protein
LWWPVSGGSGGRRGPCRAERAALEAVAAQRLGCEAGAGDAGLMMRATVPASMAARPTRGRSAGLPFGQLNLPRVGHPTWEPQDPEPHSLVAIGGALETLGFQAPMRHAERVQWLRLLLVVAGHMPPTSASASRLVAALQRGIPVDSRGTIFI